MFRTRARSASAALYDARVRVSGYSRVWREVCEGAGLCQSVQVPAGTTITVPALVDVEPGPVLVVALLPGQVAADVAALSTRLAPALGAVRLVVESAGLTHARLHLLDRDPLDDVVHLGEQPPPGVYGLAEDGSLLAVPIARRPHTVVQGQTRSGKSVWTYGQLSDGARDPELLIAGIDPTGLLFRPFEGSRHADWQVSGLTEDLAEHVALLSRLCAEMDRRLATMPHDTDVLPLDAETPAILVVLEELAGLYRVADMAGKVDLDGRKGVDLGRRVRMLVGRLLAEGHKVGLRMLLIIQRADASVIDGLSRAQCAVRISFSVSDGEAVRMLHPACEDPADVLGALPGVALMTAPGAPLQRFRAPLMDGGYGEYVARVKSAVALAG